MAKKFDGRRTCAWLALLSGSAVLGIWCIVGSPRRPDSTPSGAQPSSIPAHPAAAASHEAHSFEQHRLALLHSHYGTDRIEDLLHALAETPGGPEIQIIYQALALRKQETLPVIRERLRTGEMWEKHMLTKFLRVCPSPEAKPELLALARNDAEHWLPRQGALYALGSLGDASVGPDVVRILNEPSAGLNLQMSAISTLARIGFTGGAAAIEPFTRADNIHVRLFAIRALAELGQPVDKGFLLATLRSDDYVARQEASETLWKSDGQDVTDALRAVAGNDVHEAVRDAASQSLLRRAIAGRDAAGKVEILRQSLDTSERLTALWILRTALDDAGVEGRRFVETLAVRDDFVGERSRAYLVLADAKSR
jgi:HEAT repeat protein